MGNADLDENAPLRRKDCPEQAAPHPCPDRSGRPAPILATLEAEVAQKAIHLVVAKAWPPLAISPLSLDPPGGMLLHETPVSRRRLSVVPGPGPPPRLPVVRSPLESEGQLTSTRVNALAVTPRS